MLGAGVFGGDSSEVLATEAVILTHHEEAAVTSHLVIFHHGIDGEARDLRAIHDAIGSRDGVELWDTRANEKWRSHAGIFGCAERVWDALRPKLENIIAASSGRKLRVSFVGHSLGGLILRAVACKLHTSVQFAPHCVLDSLICIAAPHLGCRLLGNGGKGGVAPLMTAFGPSLMRAGLRMIKGKLGPELLLDNDTLERLTDDEHVASMSAFKRRLLYCNGTGDWLVNAESASLLDDKELNQIVLPLSIAQCKSGCTARTGRDSPRPSGRDSPPATPPRPSGRGSPPPTPPRNGTNGDNHGSVLWRPSDPDAASPTTLSCCTSLRLLGGALRLLPLPEDWDGAATTLLHSTWDDGLLTKAGGVLTRGQRASRLLWRLRSVGEWELHVCHFFRKSSFAGGVFSPHIDLVALPHKITQPFGLEVVKHLAERLLKGEDEEEGSFAPPSPSRPTTPPPAVVPP